MIAVLQLWPGSRRGGCSVPVRFVSTPLVEERRAEQLPTNWQQQPPGWPLRSRDVAPQLASRREWWDTRRTLLCWPLRSFATCHWTSASVASLCSPHFFCVHFLTNNSCHSSSFQLFSAGKCSSFSQLLFITGVFLHLTANIQDLLPCCHPLLLLYLDQHHLFVVDVLLITQTRLMAALNAVNDSSGGNSRINNLKLVQEEVVKRCSQLVRCST